MFARTENLQRHIQKGRLPACTINDQLLQRLWAELDAEAGFVTSIIVGTDGDLLGKEDEAERPFQELKTREELANLLKTISRVDRLLLSVEVPNKGQITIKFKNYTSPQGTLTVEGSELTWVNDKFQDLIALFNTTRDSFVTPLYSWMGFGVIQSGIPLTVSFVLIMFLADLFIPYNIRHSYWVWWLTAITMVATLRLAYTISNKLIIYSLSRYPYIKWHS